MIMAKFDVLNSRLLATLLILYNRPYRSTQVKKKKENKYISQMIWNDF